jgi:hypothetical protein
MLAGWLLRRWISQRFETTSKNKKNNSSQKQTTRQAKPSLPCWAKDEHLSTSL